MKLKIGCGRLYLLHEWGRGGRGSVFCGNSYGKQKDDPSLELIAVIPYQKRLDSLRAKRRTYEMLEACRDVVVIQEEYQPSVYSHRNRYMVEHSDRVIAVYDGREKAEP